MQRKRTRLAALALLMALSIAGPAWPAVPATVPAISTPAPSPAPAVSAPFWWAAGGHDIVCEIAFQRLSDAGRALVSTVRAHDADPVPTFYQSCVWPDSSRYEDHKSTYEYHFMDIVVPDADHLVMQRDCASYDCVQVAIVRYGRYLAEDPGDSESMQIRRANALKFLGHFVGDLHQPLHISYAHDRGGNDVAVTFFDDPEPRNLHAVWDFYLPDRMGLYDDPVVSAHRLDGEISDAEAAAWEGWDVVGWSRESYAVVKSLVYDLPPDHHIGQEYYDRAAPIIEMRLEQAGVRLAFLINEIAAGRLEFPPLFDGS